MPLWISIYSDIHRKNIFAAQMKTMARKKANEGKVRKLMDFSKSVIDTIEKKAHGEGYTFKTYAQNIIEQHAKRIK